MENLSLNILNSTAPFLIAGPCSAETPAQVDDVFGQLAKYKEVKLFRAGIWKPRTRPDSFEGVGEIGLSWLKEASKKHDIPVAIEVANSKHVELALKAEIDVFWIGARTTVNPFAVQEIAEALKGTNIPVMIKNPINPDLNLWIGAFERFMKLGITDLTAVHRGFSIYKHPKYRNIPNWEIPIGLKEVFDDVPIICDPSHISGKREGISSVAQKALDLNFDGLMIETHPDPNNAWSDAKQQLIPTDLMSIVQDLKVRREQISDKELVELVNLRKKIKTLDDQLFNILSQRMSIANEVGDFKREHHVTILQKDHWKKVIAARLKQEDDLQLTARFIRQIMDAIHQESIRHQTKVMNKE